MKKNSCLLAGFTFVETLVVATIAIVIFSLGLTKYNEFNRRQIVLQAAEAMESDLRLAQNKAFAGEKNCDGPLLGQKVEVFSDAYCFYSECQTDEGTRTWRRFPPQVEAWKDPGFGGSFLFKPLGEGVEEPGTVYLTGYGTAVGVTVKEVSVQTSGGISIRETELPDEAVRLDPTAETTPTPTPVTETPTPTPVCAEPYGSCYSQPCCNPMHFVCQDIGGGNQRCVSIP